MLSCPSPSSRICSNSRPWDAIQPSHPLSSPSPPAFNLSQHQDLFQWVSSSHQVANVLEFWYIEHIYCANIFKKNAKYFQEFNSKHKFRCVQYKEIYELFFIKFQLLCFAGEEMEAQLGLSLSLKAIEPGWNDLAAGVLLSGSTSISLKRKYLASESAKSHQSLALAQFMHCHLPCDRIKHQDILPHYPHQHPPPGWCICYSWCADVGGCACLGEG